MSIDQEMPDTEVKIESELENESVHDEQSHTEVGDHEYTIDELKQELEEAKEKITSLLEWINYYVTS